MANTGNSTIFIGNSDWYIGDPDTTVPVTLLDPDTMQSAVGGFFRLDATASSSSDSLDVLYYKWSATEVPIGSLLSTGPLFDQTYEHWSKQQLKVEVDTVGVYKIELTVWGANGGRGGTDSTVILGLPSEAPLFDNMALDTSWVWNTLPSYWSNQPREDRTKLEVLWRGALQSISSELLRAYNTDDSKSILSIQESVYDRWTPIYLDVQLEDASIKVHRIREGVLSDISGRQATASLDHSVWFDLVDDRVYSFEGTIISPTEVVPHISRYSDFVPSAEDVGRVLTIEAAGATFNVKISYVDDNWRGRQGRYRYILEDSLVDPLSSSIGINIGGTYLIGIRYIAGSNVLPLPVIIEGEPNLLLSYSSVERRAYFYKDIPSGAESFKSYPALILENAERLGVSSGDHIYVNLNVLDSVESVAVRLKALGTVPYPIAGRDLHYVLFDTVVSKFSEISETFLQLFSQPESVISEWKEATRSTPFLDSVEGRAITSESNNSINIFGGDRLYSYSVTPLKITRLSKVLIDSDIVSLIKLSEFVEDNRFEIGQVITEGDRTISLDRPPLHLIENRDFTLISEESADGESLKYINFITDTHTLNTPRRLWSETLVRSNHRRLDSTFGALLSFPYEEWSQRSLSMSYKSILASMLAARVSGPSLRNLQRVLSVLCGIPFVENRCRVISIDDDLDPTLVTRGASDVRVVVEDIDSEGRATNKIRSYKIASPTEDSNLETSGLYYGGGVDGRITVGDILEPFTPLGLGALIEDSLTDYRGQFREVADRHRFKARADIDSTTLRTAGDVNLLFDFIRDIKPSYVDFILSLFKYNVDRIDIKSRAIVVYRSRFFDNPYLLRGPADIYDDEIPGRALNDLSSYTVLSTWFPKDGVVSINEDGSLTLTSESSYFTVESLSDGFIRYPGNFISPLIPHRYTKDWINLDDEGNLVQAWIRGRLDILASNRSSEATLPDYVVFRSGIAEGMYRIEKVLSKTQLRISPIGPDQASLSLFEGSKISFVVARLSTEVLFDGVLYEGGDRGVHLVGEGLINDGIAAGDELSFPGTTRGRYTIREVRYERTDRGEPAVFVNPYGYQLLRSELNPDNNAPIRAVVRRPQLANSDRGEFTIVKAETKYGSYAYRVEMDGVVSPASIGLSLGDRVLSNDGMGIDTNIVGIFGSLLWLAYAPDIPQSSVSVTRNTGISVGSLDDVDTTLGSSCLIVSRSTDIPRQSWSSRHVSSIVAEVGLSEDLMTKLTLEDPLHSSGGNTLVKAVCAGDMIKIITPMSGAPTSADLAEHPFVDGFGLLRVVEVIDNVVIVSQPLPLPSTYVGGSFSVKLVRQPKLSSTYWRIS